MASKNVNIAASLIIIFLVVAILYLLKGLVVPLLFALIFGVMLFPVCRFFEKWRFPRAWLQLCP